MRPLQQPRDLRSCFCPAVTAQASVQTDGPDSPASVGTRKREAPGLARCTEWPQHEKLWGCHTRIKGDNLSDTNKLYPTQHEADSFLWEN